MDQVPQLVATSGPLKGSRFPVTETGITLGREDSCDVVIPDQNVSREHARLLLHNGTVWVQDLGSRNGVYVNQKRVMKHRAIGPGDMVTIGAHAFRLELSTEDEEQSVSAARPISGARGWRTVLTAVALGALGAVIALWLVNALRGAP